MHKTWQSDATGATQKRASAVEEGDLRLDRWQPVLRPLAHVTTRWDAAFALTLGVLVASRLLVTIPDGTFGPPGDIVADLVAIVTGRPAAGATPSTPWLRDYADIAIMVLIAWHTAHMASQWRRVSHLPSELRNANLIAGVLRRRETYSAIIARHQARFDSPMVELLAIVGAVLVTWQLAQLPAHGIYPAVGPQGSAVDRYQWWWASWPKHPAAFAVLIASFAAYVYLAFRQGLAGLLFLGLLWDARKRAAAAGQHVFGYESAVGEHTAAITELRDVLSDILLSITLLVVAFLIGTLYVEIPAPLVATLIVPYVVLNPLLIIVPLRMFNGRFAETRLALITVAEREVRLASEQAKLGTRRSGRGRGRVPVSPEACALRLKAAESALRAAEALPASVVDLRWLLRGTVLYLVPVAGLAWSILRSP